MQSVIDYLIKEYDPETILLYGSYADGTNNAGSDMDVLVIADQDAASHDVSVVDGVQLDAFIYPADRIPEPSELPQLYHCRVVLDRNGRGEQLRRDVISYIDSFPAKSVMENCSNISWCEKMVQRIQREDAEGFYRWHWVLCDSLEFYCDIRKRFYFGPKKTLLWMGENDPEAYECYLQALSHLDAEKLAAWVRFLKRQIEG